MSRIISLLSENNNNFAGHQLFIIISVRKMSDKAAILRNYTWNERVLIGQGAYSNVYKVKRKAKGNGDSKLDDWVAIKEINMKDSSTQELVKNEVELMKKIRHPNILELLEYHIGEDVSYEVMPYCQMNLRTFMQHNKGRLQEQEAIDILVQIINGMKEIRMMNFVHRDLKPDNILLKAGQIKICDFGLAVYCKEGNRLLRYCGTPFYMSPQIIWKKYYTSKADIWSIGVIFYEMLFGYTPWACRDEKSYKNNIKENTLKFPFDVPIGSLSKDLIIRCLQLEEQNRLSWEEIFNHGLIKREGPGEMTHAYKISKDLLPILKALQLSYYNSAKKVQQAFMRYAHQKLLNIVDFYQSYRNFYPINLKQNRLIFQQADINTDGKVSYDELIKILCWYDFEGDDIPNKIIRDLRSIILNNNIDLDRLFRESDLNQNGTLDLSELQTLIRIVAPNIISYDVRQVFDKVDLDRDGKITREEAEAVLKANQPPQSHLQQITSNTMPEFKKKYSFQSAELKNDMRPLDITDKDESTKQSSSKKAITTPSCFESRIQKSKESRTFKSSEKTQLKTLIFQRKI